MDIDTADNRSSTSGDEVRQDRLDAESARLLTDEVKADAAALWVKLLRLYEGGAHLALGYSSWGAYCDGEFEMSKSRAYQVLDAARVVEALPHSTMVDSDLSERAARELVPVLRDDPEQVPEVWAEVVEEHGDQPTAAQVREHVEPRHARRPPRGMGIAAMMAAFEPPAPKPRSHKQDPHKLLANVVEQITGTLAALEHIDVDAAMVSADGKRDEWDKDLTFVIQSLSALRKRLRARPDDDVQLKRQALTRKLLDGSEEDST
jgi:hypothetical protein